jgi:hypothetical protein
LLVSKELHVGSIVIPLEEREPSAPRILEFMDLSSSQQEKLDEIWKKSVASPDARWCHSSTTKVGKDILSKNPPSTVGIETTHNITTSDEHSLGKVVFPQGLHVVNLSNDLDNCVQAPMESR